jgi:hypothetical protein
VNSIVNKDLIGKAAAVTLSAWDLESATPYSSTVDLGTGCWVYKNGRYSNTSSGTIGTAITSRFTVGDVATVYCGGTTYYADVAEKCIDSEAVDIDIDAHTMSATTDLSIVAYDSTGATALTAGVSGWTDYNVTLGAASEETIYLKLKDNVAHKAFRFGGWAVTEFTNVSDVYPSSGFTKEATPVYMSSLGINMVSTGTSLTNYTEDYVPYVRSSPLMLKQWEETKTQFIVKAHSTNDPVGLTMNSTGFNGFAIVAFDATRSRGADGSIYDSYYTHDTSESNVGITETLTSPYGKDNGVLICTV